MILLPFLVHALSPLHAGTGQSADLVDLPIARMRATNMPFVPGSSIKGVLRDARSGGAGALPPDEIDAIFGPDTDNAHLHAGAISVGDARLLLLPVRSFYGTFAYVTSPLLLELARRDLGADLPLPQWGGRGARLPESGTHRSVDPKRGELYLEDLDIRDVQTDAAVARWADLLAGLLADDDASRSAIRDRFVVVDDDTMSFLWDTCTQIDTRVRIDGKTRTAATGQLWVEESLPPETVLIGLFGAERTRSARVERDPQQVLHRVLPSELMIQLGGKSTVGRGRCRIMAASPSEVAR